MEIAPTDIVSCCNPFSRMLHVYHVLPRRLSFLSFLSLSSINILRIESLIHPYELEIESNFERARSHVSGCSRAGALVSFPIRSINASSWRQGSISRPSEIIHQRKLTNNPTKPPWLGPTLKLCVQLFCQFMLFPFCTFYVFSLFVDYVFFLFYTLFIRRYIK